MSRSYRFALVFAGVSILVIAATSWFTWMTVPPPPPAGGYHVVRRGEDLYSIALRYGVDVKTLAQANNITSPEDIYPGQRLFIPERRISRLEEWGVHILGLAGEAVGVFISLWLTRAAGLLPRRARKQIVGISLAIAVVSYATSQAAQKGTVTVSPQFLFQTIKDGFAWSTSLPLFAKAFGQVDEVS